MQVLQDHSALLQEKTQYYTKLCEDKVQTDTQLRELRNRDAAFADRKNQEIIASLRIDAD